MIVRLHSAGLYLFKAELERPSLKYDLCDRKFRMR